MASTALAAPPELRLEALQETVITLDAIVSTLHLDPRAFCTARIGRGRHGRTVVGPGEEEQLAQQRVMPS